ncbi:unnamed protein product [marine sediment metagenome]|uniref:Uncharacterized protein n=1 Tax=marine sediment metagenome TaxID=412755 RepID=X1CHZ6_9ZZZZ
MYLNVHNGTLKYRILTQRVNKRIWQNNVTTYHRYLYLKYIREILQANIDN